MKLYPRLLLSHLLVIALALGALLLCSELLVPAFVRHHIEEMVRLIGPAGASLRPDLERGVRETFTSALLAALPVAALVAAVTARAAAQRVVRSVRRLSDGSRAVASGEYGRRLPENGRDELADLARHFNRMAGALATVEQGRVDLIRDVAHELRTPLAALRGYAEALSDGVLPAETVARAVAREVDAMERLARDLSLVSRVEAGQIELHLAPVAPQALLDAARERFAAAFDGKGVHLDVQEASGVAAVQADPERAAQVLANLLSNALRHTPAGGRVTLRARPDGGAVAFNVADTGNGIAPDHLARVFERFYRADAARSRADGGSGVGLTIARGLAEQMGGRLVAHSQAGAGSTFTLTLPLAQAGVQPPTAPTARGASQADPAGT